MFSITVQLILGIFIDFLALVYKRCPHWDILDEIYGTKASIVPPFRHETGDPSELIGEFEIPNPFMPFDDIEVPSTQPEETEEEATYVLANKVGLTKTKTMKKTKPNDSLTALTEAQLKRAEAVSAKVELDRTRLEYEDRWKSEALDLDRKRFESDKELRMLESQKEERLKILELEKEERLERFKIEQEFKLQLDLAKLKN
jgi:hypothetical protein